MILCDRCGKLLNTEEAIKAEVSIDVENARELNLKIKDMISLVPFHKEYMLCAECYNELRNELAKFLEKFPEAFLTFKLGEKPGKS